MSYIDIPNLWPNKFWDSPAFVLKRVCRCQPSPEELAASLEENRVWYGIPTAIDRWITTGLNLGPPRTCSAQDMSVPMLTKLLEDWLSVNLALWKPR